MRKRVLVYGVWDLLHVGHLRFLREAKLRFGNAQLFVGVVPDAQVTEDKGPLRPVVPAVERAELLETLWMVDGVLINPEPPTAVAMIEMVQPDVYYKGSDYSLRGEGQYHTRFLLEKAATERGGGIVEFSSLPRVWSTSDIIQGIVNARLEEHT